MGSFLVNLISQLEVFFAVGGMSGQSVGRDQRPWPSSIKGTP